MPRKGKTDYSLSKKTRQKISLSMRGERNPNYGKSLSEETRQKISEALRGSRNPKWKGGLVSEEQRIRNSGQYQNWKKAVWTRDECQCVKCGSGEKISAHHILPFKEYPEERFALDNGITWCYECHSDYHGFPIGT